MGGGRTTGTPWLLSRQQRIPHWPVFSWFKWTKREDIWNVLRFASTGRKVMCKISETTNSTEIYFKFLNTEAG